MSSPCLGIYDSSNPVLHVMAYLNFSLKQTITLVFTLLAPTPLKGGGGLSTP